MSIGMLGKYERLDILGHGASGIVYLAQDTLLKRRVALKEINAQGEEQRRVIEEARVLDRLRHPNIVAVNSVDTINGKVIIDMEYVEGSNLMEILRESKGPLPLRDCLSIASQICDGLAYAHSKRTVHRDIKPANILVSDSQEVKLADFGLAQVLGSNSYAGGAGTYAYMAPEDFDEGDRSDRQSDLWSVGVILYEMLAGRRPFSVQNARDPFAWSRAITNDEIKPPSFYQPGIPHEIDEICLKALQRDKQLRYRDAAEIAEDLRRVLQFDTTRRVTVGRRLETPSEHDRVAPETLLGASDIDEFVKAASYHWTDAGHLLESGELLTWLDRIDEPLLAGVVIELREREDETLDDRIRDFLYRAGCDVEKEARTDATAGGTLIADRKYPEAVEALQRAVNLDPHQPSYYRMLAQAARGAGDIELSREALLGALERHPNDRSLKRDLAVIGGAVPELSEDSADFGKLHHGEAATRQITLYAVHSESVKGRIAAAPGWVAVSPLTFNARGKQVLKLDADSGNLPSEGQEYNDLVRIETSGGTIELPVSIAVMPVRMSFREILPWYVLIFAVCLTPTIVGEIATLMSYGHGRWSYSPGGMLASGLLFASFLAVTVVADLKLFERLAVGAGLMFLPLGAYQWFYLWQHRPESIARTWPVMTASLLLAALAPALQSIACIRYPETFCRWKIWCTVIVALAVLISLLIWHVTES